MPALELTLAAAVVLLGAFAQSATGFGMSAVAAPALFAVMEPTQAVTVLVVLGVVVSVLTLFTERRARSVRWGELRQVLVAGVPGVVAGALLLRALSQGVLQVLVGAAVFASALVQIVGRSRSTSAGHDGGRAAGGGPAGYAIGLLTGALTTSTNLNGPPLAAWLLARGARPDQLHDTVTAGLLALIVAAVPVLAALGALNAASWPALVVLALVAVAGQRLGRAAFLALDAARYELLLLAGLMAAGLASIVAGFR